MTPEDQVRFAVFVVVLLAGGIFALVQGLDGSDGRRVVAAADGLLFLVCAAGARRTLLGRRQNTD